MDDEEPTLTVTAHATEALNTATVALSYLEDVADYLRGSSDLADMAGVGLADALCSTSQVCTQLAAFVWFRHDRAGE